MEDSGIDSGDHNGEQNSKPPGSDSSSADSGQSPPKMLPASSSRQLQRRLEARIEHARRLHQEYHATSGGLIPIQRLPIPGAKDHQPLVQWDSDDSEEDIVNFFPLSRKESRAHQEITDTFSIEEMSISGDDEEEEEDLHLVPPQTAYKKIKAICCQLMGANAAGIKQLKISKLDRDNFTRKSFKVIQGKV